MGGYMGYCVGQWVGSSQITRNSIIRKLIKIIQFCLKVFRWFKFTLKLPNSITLSKLRLAIWDTSFWNFFGHIWTQWTLRHILGPTLVIFDIWHFLKISGPFEYFQKMGALRKSHFTQKRRAHSWIFSLVLCAQVPRLNHGPIFFPVWNT